MNNSFASVWQRIAVNVDRPFLMPNGREFHYQIEGEAVHFSCHREPVQKSVVEEALQTMPCESFHKLPRHLKPRNVLWTLLNDTRIYERTKFAEYEPSAYWEKHKGS